MEVKNAGRDTSESRSKLGVRLEQLNALLAVTYGTGGESFRCYSAEIQDNYLSLCHDLAQECGSLVGSPSA